MGLTVTQLSFDFGGSNPSLPTINLKINKFENLKIHFLNFQISKFLNLKCGSSSVDRALAFQAEGRGFEPRLPLSKNENTLYGAKSLSRFIGKPRLPLSIREAHHNSPKERVFFFILNE